VEKNRKRKHAGNWPLASFLFSLAASPPLSFLSFSSAVVSNHFVSFHVGKGLRRRKRGGEKKE
jgi:hypothetical protein